MRFCRTLPRECRKDQKSVRLRGLAERIDKETATAALGVGVEPSLVLYFMASFALNSVAFMVDKTTLVSLRLVKRLFHQLDQ